MSRIIALLIAITISMSALPAYAQVPPPPVPTQEELTFAIIEYTRNNFDPMRDYLLKRVEHHRWKADHPLDAANPEMDEEFGRQYVTPGQCRSYLRDQKEKIGRYVAHAVLFLLKLSRVKLGEASKEEYDALAKEIASMNWK